MTEIESQVLEQYKKLLGQKDGISDGLIEALIAELGHNAPNTERLAELLKRGKVTDDKA